MSQFLQLVPPDEARALLLFHLSGPFDSDQAGLLRNTEIIYTAYSMGRVSAEEIVAPHLAGSHLLDSQTGEYNIPYIRKYMPGIPVKLIALTKCE